MKARLLNIFLALALLAINNFARSATITWTNTAGGNWSVAANWSPNEVPGPTDDVLITSNGTYLVTLDTNATINSLTLGAVSGEQTFTNGSFSLTLNNASVIRNNGIFGVNGGGFVVSSNLVVQGAINWSGGQFGQVGQLNSALTIATNGVLNIAADSVMSMFGVLTNAGTVRQEGPVFATGEIWNQAGALWDIQSDQNDLGYGGAGPFHNAGILQKSAGTGTTTVSLFLNNSGTVHAKSGTIQFNGGTDLGGSFQADANAAIYFNGGSFTLSSPPTNFQGPGTVQFTSINLTLDEFTGTYSLNSTIKLIGQNTVAAAGAITVNGNELASDSSLTIATNGVLNILGGFSVLGGLTNQGTVNWQGGFVFFPVGIWNQAGAVWDIQCDQDVLGDSGDQFHNTGVLQKSAGTGTTPISAYLDNSATVHAESGMIQFNGSYIETSSASQVIGIGGSAPGSGYGQIQFSSPTFAGSFNVTLLNGFRPNPGDSFSVLSYPSVTGDFTSMNGLDLGNGLKLVPQFGNTGLILVAATYPISAKPSLSLYSTPNDVLVSWPLNFTGWQLQTTTNLATHVWTPMSVPGTNNNIVLPRPGLKGFFRLKGS